MPTLNSFRALRTVALAALAVLATLPASLTAQDDMAGRWEGLITTPQGSLTIVFEIEATDDGLTTTMYSPDQVPQPIPTGSTTFEEGRLVIEVPIAQARYEGTLNDEGGVDGTWYQGPAELELDIAKVEG